ncbi:MAG: acyloxyacyl hydrolase [Chlorobi bacterium]|nr:acyloxyacyl hydrolase [Chlorobiota bacterium]
MIKKIFVFITLFLVVSGGGMLGGNILKKNNIQLEARLHYGFLLSQHLELERFNSHFPMFEISLQKATFGQGRWEKKYDYPLLGTSFLYNDIGGYKEIGNAYAIFPYINFPLFRDDKSTYNFRLGLGLAYLENKFDNINNYKNFAIGSHLNIAANLQLEYRRQISKRLTFSFATTLTHFSNGTIKTPNYGLNLFTTNIAFAYSLSEPRPYGGRMLLPDLYTFEFDGRKYLEINVIVVVSNKDMSQDIGERFMVYASYFNIMKRVSYKSKFGLGLDITADLSDKYFLARNLGHSSSSNDLSYIKTGISGAYELVISRTSFLFNLGLYIGGKIRKHGDAYQRLTLKYLISKNLTANLALSTHAGTADYIGIGLGYRLRFIYARKVKHY